MARSTGVPISHFPELPETLSALWGMADRKKLYRLYKPAICTPVVMRGFPSQKWIRPHHFVPLHDTGAKPSVGLEFNGSRRRSRSRHGTIYSVVPEVVKSSTSSTASSTSPERNRASRCDDINAMGDRAEDITSFSDLNQRASHDFFLFDFDHAFDDGQSCWDECSYSTVSTKSLYLHGQSIDILSFEDFTEDEFEDAQECTTDHPTSPFILCPPSSNLNDVKQRFIEDRQRAIRKSRPIQSTQIATSEQARHIFPPIDRPKKPPQIPMVVANPIAVVKTPIKVASIAQKQHIRLNDDRPNAAGKGTIGTTTLGDEADISSLHSNPQRQKSLKMPKVGFPMAAVRSETANDAHLQPIGQKHFKPKKAGNAQRFRVPWENFHPDPAPSGPSLWSQIGLDEDWLHDIVVGHDKVKTLFEKSPSPKPLSTDVKRCQVARIIESKRANNCAVFLASLNLSCHEIASSVDHFNHAAFTSDQIQKLLKFLPTEKETEVLKTYLEVNPNPHYLEAESYMVQMIKVEDAATKLDVMAIMKRFLFCCQSVASGMSDSFATSPYSSSSSSP